MCLFRWVKIVKGESKGKWKTKFSVFDFDVSQSVSGKDCERVGVGGKRKTGYFLSSSLYRVMGIKGAEFLRKQVGFF